VVPIKTSIDDIAKVVGYMSRQVGWVELAKVEKALGGIDERKIGAMVEFGLILRDGGNVKIAPRGLIFNGGDRAQAMREVLSEVELYRSTVEWMHYQAKAEVSATEIGQYWESSHSDSLGSLKGSTLNDGAVTFGRVVGGAGLGTFTIGRGGKVTRVSLDLEALEAFVTGSHPANGPGDEAAPPNPQSPASTIDPPPTPFAAPPEPAPAIPVTVSASPNVHVNVEIHIAADATADTVREIFKNMARYVLDKDIEDDDS
jgi:hypothetical protein